MNRSKGYLNLFLTMLKISLFIFAVIIAIGAIFKPAFGKNLSFMTMILISARLGMVMYSVQGKSSA